MPVEVIICFSDDFDLFRYFSIFNTEFAVTQILIIRFLVKIEFLFARFPMLPSRIIWCRPSEGVIPLPGKVTAGWVESNGSLPWGF